MPTITIFSVKYISLPNHPSCLYCSPSFICKVKDKRKRKTTFKHRTPVSLNADIIYLFCICLFFTESSNSQTFLQNGNCLIRLSLTLHLATGLVSRLSNLQSNQTGDQLVGCRHSSVDSSVPSILLP